ncbi:MAG: MOSC domain-containing protein [Alphaproteobacteria bacterium]|nr:MOSC domain-containing protein [Alphaproteobacteria bacterium]
MGEMAVGTVARLWRYPVSGMAGEELESVAVVGEGLLGDRVWGLADPATGAKLTTMMFRREHDLLHWAARYEAPPRPGAAPPVTLDLPDGDSVRSDAADIGARIAKALGRPAVLAPLRWRETPSPATRPEDINLDSDAERPIHVMTTATLARIAQAHAGADIRRFRPNIVIATPAGAAGFVEDEWVGRTLTLGGARLRVLERSKRCAITTMSQRDLADGPGVLKAVTAANGAYLGVFASVEASGPIRLGDAARLLG